ncbi:MAG: acyl-CoA/acyl-ACP dehydrogenase [Planctomycetales bacterium]|nr:acyl-CoA/acyl-ACP dehydrogenase [Planctomycetales bacterium]
MPRMITAPDDPQLDELCEQLAQLAPQLENPGAWPADQLDLCAKYGVFDWFLPRDVGGLEWSEGDVTRGYAKLSSACLTTTFVITQRAGACRRIAVGDSQWAREQLLPDLRTGHSFATVGISHLTTSRRHLGRPVLRATEIETGWLLDGYSPWVTGAPAADTVVVGATLSDGREVLIALPTNLPGVHVPQPANLIGLNASQTGPVECEQVEVDARYLLAGPQHDVMKSGSGANTGGLQTSTLAVGLADAAIGFIEGESDPRRELVGPAATMRDEWQSLYDELLAAAEGRTACSASEVRRRANSLVLRAAQAALAAAKGAGYIVGHPAGRWCREALFFLVWSCPQPVMEANLCELAGMNDL